MASRYPITETERTFQYRALRQKSRHICGAPDPKHAAQELLNGLKLLIQNKQKMKSAQ